MNAPFPIICYVRALHNYQAETTGDLSLQAGDIIQVHDNDGDWWKGSLLQSQEYGTFPSNFVEPVAIENAQYQFPASITASTVTSRPRSLYSTSPSRQPLRDSVNQLARKPVKSVYPQSPAIAMATQQPIHPTNSTTKTESHSPAAPNRRNPQAIVHHDMLDSSVPSESLFPNHNQNTPLPVPPVASTPASPMTRLTQKLVTDNSSTYNTSLTSGARSTLHSRQPSPAPSVRQESLTKYNQGSSTPKSTRSTIPGAWPEPTEEENHHSLGHLVDRSTQLQTDGAQHALDNQESIHISNDAVYNPHYAEKNVFNGGVSSHLNPSGPAYGSSSVSQTSLHPHHSPNSLEPYTLSRMMNRRSMPDLGIETPQGVGLDEFGDSRSNNGPSALNREQLHSGFYLQETNRRGSATRSANHLPIPWGTKSTHSSANRPSLAPKPIKAAWSKPFSPPPPSKQAGSKTNSRLLRNNFSNFSAFSSAPTPKEQQLYQEKFQQQLEEQEKLTYSNSVHRPGALELAPEHLNEHSRSQGALESMQQQHQQRGSDQDKYQLTLHQHQRRERPELHHGRSKSQVDLRSQASSMTQANGQQSQHLENGHRLSQSSYRRRLGSDNGQHPTVFIPPPDQTSSQLIPKSADTSAEKDPSSGLSPPFCLRQSMPVSPPTPSTAVTTATSGTPDWSCPRSAGTSMSDASILMGAKAMSSRAWNRLSLSSRTTSLRQSGESTRDHSSDDTSLSSGLDDNIEDLDNPDPDNLPMFVDGMIFQARKPKPTLMRAIKQIVNPRKVAEKDALKSQQEHFAWVEMQKSLRRVRSPEPGGKHDFYLQYFPPIGSTVVSRTPAGMSSLRTDDTVTTTPFSEIDPFEALKLSHNLKDHHAGASLEVNPTMFIQADKLARNVNQKSSQLTPVLLSQKYLTRPYARSPLLKLRVLFIWVSENIRLEGGAMRDVSGGRYKLGPAGDVASTYHPSVNGNISPVVTSVIAKAINETLKASSSPPNPRRTPASSSTNLAAAAAIATLSPNGSNGAGNSLVEGTPSSPPFVVSAATAAAFLQGMDDCSKGFLMEDEPESAQEVLTNRVCRTGEGFANLFAEMAVAAGIEDVGVVKGYLKGPMDVFAKEIPPPNHAWNVVKIDGVYRFIDCCLASPFYPGNYPNKSKEARSFYFLTPPSDMILTHFPTFLTYQYIAPPITSSIFLQLPFVRPAFFEFGLRFLDFKKRTRLEIKDDQPVEVFIVIGAGEGVDLRAEVEAMTAEGKVSKKRALAQVTIWRPNPNLLSSLSGSGISPDGEDVSATASTMSTTAGPYPFSSHQGTKHGLPASQLSALATAAGMTAVGSHGANGIHPGSPSSGRLGGRAGAGLCGIRIAKIKAVLPTETVKSVGGIRKGVLHIYAGRKVENALTDAIPYALAVSLPIRHTGTLPRTPFSFVLPHFSPYEYYIKAPQTELLYYPHTYKFSIVSLAALSQATSTPLPSPIQWADYSPSTSAVFDSHPITPNGSSVLQHAQSPSSATSPPPLATKRSAGVGSSTTSMTGSPKVTTTDLASSPSNGSYASTLSGAKPSHLSQRRASHHYTGSSSSSGTSGQVSLPPPVPAVGSSTVTTATTHVTATQATPAMTMTLGPYGAVLSTSSRLKQHSSSSSLASPSRVSQHYNHTPRHGHPPLHPSSHNNHSASSLSATLGTGGGGHVRRHSSSSACSISPSAGGAAMSASSVFAQSIGHPAVARPERLVLRSQTNRIYKLVYDPVRQCHEAQMEIKERGLWECVRLDDGGKGRVGREGAGGVVIASWRCV